jgi:hypothetical protein
LSSNAAHHLLAEAGEARFRQQVDADVMRHFAKHNN